MQTTLQDWRDLILRGGLERLFILHSADGWHEQDFLRLLNDMYPERFCAAGKELVYHAVHGAAAELDRRDGEQYEVMGMGIKPVLVHFAGGSWKRFESLREAYGQQSSQVASRFAARLRVVVFGAGTDCRRYLEQRPAGEQVVAVVDSRRELQGTTIGEYTIQSPDQLAKLDFDQIRIASSATYAIYRQLLEDGFAEDKLISPMLEPKNRQRLERLKGAHDSQPALILGTGASLKQTDLDLFCGFQGVTLGYDQIFRTFDRTRFRPQYLLLEHPGVAGRYSAAIRLVDVGVKLIPEVLVRRFAPDSRTVLFGLSRPSEGDELPFTIPSFLNVRQVRSVVFTAIQIALLMGCEPVYLVGIDAFAPLPWSRNRGRTDWRGWPVEREQPELAPEVSRAFAAAQNYAVTNGRHIYNATRGGYVDTFPRIRFDDLVQQTCRIA